MPTRTVTPIVFACLTAFGQPSAPGSPEAPTWPSSNEIPQSLQCQYVFVGPNRDMLIVRVPPDSAYARSGNPPVIRYDLHNRLNPEITARLIVDQQGNYVYEYVVDNAPSSVDSIGKWDLLIPATQTEEPKISCGDWCGGTSFAPIMRQVEMPDQPKGRVVMWVRQNGGSPIAPSQSRRGFRIESSCRPGFTTALFHSGIWVNIDQDLPDEVFKQLEFYNDPTWGQIPALTFGPMFCAGSSRPAIAQNMISGINRLLETKRLDPKSEFVHDVLALVRSQLKEGAEDTGPIVHLPSGEMETEIGRALELNLSLRIGAP